MALTQGPPADVYVGYNDQDSSKTGIFKDSAGTAPYAQHEIPVDRNTECDIIFKRTDDFTTHGGKFSDPPLTWNPPAPGTGITVGALNSDKTEFSVHDKNENPEKDPKSYSFNLHVTLDGVGHVITIGLGAPSGNGGDHVIDPTIINKGSATF